jgi:YidC/Oxa1 family membrane protein insertase
MSEQRNLMIAVILSIGVLVGYHYFFEKTPLPQAPVSSSLTEEGIPQPLGTSPLAQAPLSLPVTREKALSQSPRLAIETPEIKGSINLRGGKIDDITLVNHHQTIDPHSAGVALFSPAPSQDAYYADFGWVAPQGGISLPKEDTVWTADHSTLRPGQPVTLKWDNGEGLVFEKKIQIDDKFMITVTQKVINKGSKVEDFHSYGLMVRQGSPPSSGMFILHEGPLGVFDGRLKEVDYKKLRETPLLPNPTNGGWLGITDKYWLGALVPDQNLRVDTAFRYMDSHGKERYQVDILNPVQRLEPRGEIAASYHLFAGPKVVNVLDEYGATLGIPRFDLAVDFGWFYFLTKPLFHVLNFLHQLVGNFGLAILLLTVLVKLLFFPLANKSYRSMAKMKKLQPDVEKLRAKFDSDKVKMNQELMALYKKEKVNPLSGCLPILLQFPVFFALYKVLFVSIEMRHAPFFGWVKDLAAPDPTTLFNLFGLISWQPPEMLLIGAWPLLMGVTMVLQQKLNPQPADPIQAKMFMIMPLMFTVMLAQFPVGLVIYWAWSNILSIGQQWMILRLEGKEVGKK